MYAAAEGRQQVLLRGRQQQLLPAAWCPRALLLLLPLLLLQLLPQTAAMSADAAAQPEKVAAAAAAVAAAVGPRADSEMSSQPPAPVIGVLIQPVDENLPEEINGVSRQQSVLEGVSYLAASYIKYIEAAGCVALPIDLSLSEDEHKFIFSQIDGLLLPGGSAEINDWNAPYMKTTKLYYELAKESNEAGKFFPIVGICLGFEALVIVASGNLNYFKREFTEDLDRRRELSFTEEAENSVLFGWGVFPGDEKTKKEPSSREDPSAKGQKSAEIQVAAPAEDLKRESSSKNETEAEKNEKNSEIQVPDPVAQAADLATLRSTFAVDRIRQLLGKQPIAYFHHFKLLSTDEFHNDEKLKKEWRLTATAKIPEENKLEIVAAVEHRQFPFFGMQFHPEKALFEHCDQSQIPHSFASVLPSWYIAALIGLLARLSHNAFKDKKLKFDSVAFAFKPTRTATYGRFYSFEQVYLFPQELRQQMRKQMFAGRPSSATQLQQQQQKQLQLAVAADEA